MNALKTTILFLSVTLSGLAHAVENDAAIGADFEVDPLAYALGGASLHAGLHVSKTRFDLGVFALPVPAWIHGNDGLSRDGVGFGFKADRFFGLENTGLHVGVSLDVTTNDYVDDASGVSVTRLEAAPGGRLGWRFQHRSGLYVNPWVGVFAPIVNGGDVEVADKTFNNPAAQLFPTLHVGWRMR